MLRALLTLVLVFVAMPALAEVCTFSTSGTWGPFATFSGTDDCTLDDTDSVIIPDGVTVTVNADIASASASTGTVKVESGGVLKIDTTANSNSPIEFTLGTGSSIIGGDVPVYIDIDGGTLEAVPSYVEAGRNNATPGYVSARSGDDVEWIAAEVYHCATAVAGSPTINCGTHGANVLFRWSTGSLQADATPTTPRSLYLNEAMDNIIVGQTLCMTGGFAKGLCGVVSAKNDPGGLGPYDILIEMDGSPQDLENGATSYTLAYRDSQTLTTSAAAAKGETCIEVSGAVVTSTLSYMGRAIEIPGHNRPFRIERTYPNTTCDGTVSGTQDAIHLGNPRGLKVDVASSASVTVTFGVARGDTFEVFSAPTFVDGTAGVGNGSILFRNSGVPAGEAFVFDGVSSVVFDESTSGITARGWVLYDGGEGAGGDWVKLRAIGNNYFDYVRWMGDQPAQESHPLVIRPAGSGSNGVTVTHSSCYFHGDDCIGTQGSNPGYVRISNSWSMFSALDSASDISGQLFDGTGNDPLLVVIDDSGCVNGNRVGSATVTAPGFCVISESPGAISRLTVFGCDDCQIIRGDAAFDIPIDNVYAAGLKQVAPGQPMFDRAYPDRLYLTNSMVGDNNSLENFLPTGATNSYMIGLLGSGDDFLGLSASATYDNNVFADFTNAAATTVNNIINIQACGSADDCTIVFRNNTFVNSPGETTRYEFLLRWPNLDTNHAVGAHTFVNNCQVDMRIGEGGTGTGGGITANMMDLSTTELSYFGTFSPNLWYDLAVAPGQTYSNALREWDTALSATIEAAGLPMWRGIDPGFDEKFIPLPGGFAKTQGLCAGALIRPGLNREGEYLTMVGITLGDLGFSAAGGGGRPTFAPTPFGYSPPGRTGRLLGLTFAEPMPPSMSLFLPFELPGEL